MGLGSLGGIEELSGLGFRSLGCAQGAGFRVLGLSSNLYCTKLTAASTVTLLLSFIATCIEPF